MTQALAIVSPDNVITFAEGLPGFEHCSRFLLVTSATLAPFTLIQGVDGDSPSFVAIEPQLVERDYAASLAASDLVRLAADGEGPLLWLALVAAHDDGSATVNLRAPVVINPASMRGIQLIAAESRYRVDHPLASE